MAVPNRKKYGRRVGRKLDDKESKPTPVAGSCVHCSPEKLIYIILVEFDHGPNRRRILHIAPTSRMPILHAQKYRPIGPQYDIKP